uniref:Feruloyl esterase n=1 Tax=Alexandrium monilatum TaxID=311494 RepID=A0A7S4PT37_9DINO
MRQPGRAHRRSWRLLGAGAVVAVQAVPSARNGTAEGSRRRALRQLKVAHFGGGPEGPGCPATAEPALNHELHGTEAAIVARVQARNAGKLHQAADARGTAVARGDSSRGKPNSTFAGQDPLEVALAQLLDDRPRVGVTSVLPTAPLVDSYPTGLHHLEILPGPGVPKSIFGRLDRRPYLLYVPESYFGEEHIPLWIHAPGTDVAMETVYTHNAYLGHRCTIAMVILSGLWHRMSVSLHAQGSHDPWPDDVAYTRAVLQEVMQRVRVDPRRVRCMGFSRGGRFCSRLASELSGFVSAIAAVSGIRFPEPNNATRPVPVIALHGLRDVVNPFKGGNPPYWGESVMVSVQKWASFNSCMRHVRYMMKADVEVIKYTDCRENADVILIKLLNAGHEWPPLGTINARVAILQFFSDHLGPDECHTVTEDDERYRQCAGQIAWAKRVGIVRHPRLYGGLTSSSGSKDIQLVLRRQVYADCPEPCRDEASSAGLWAEQLPSAQLPASPAPSSGYDCRGSWRRWAWLPRWRSLGR